MNPFASSIRWWGARHLMTMAINTFTFGWCEEKKLFSFMWMEPNYGSQTALLVCHGLEFS